MHISEELSFSCSGTRNVPTYQSSLLEVSTVRNNLTLLDHYVHRSLMTQL